MTKITQRKKSKRKIRGRRGIGGFVTCAELGTVRGLGTFGVVGFRVWLCGVRGFKLLVTTSQGRVCNCWPCVR